MPLYPSPRRVRAFLRRGGVIAYATESCYGLGCDPRKRSAVAHILKLKRRPWTKGLILIGSAPTQFQRFLAPLPTALSERLDAWWPGPNTLLLPAAARCPAWLRGRHDKLAVRVTAHAPARQLCQSLGMALVSTSANLSGRHPLKTAAACRRTFGDQVLVLAGRIGKRKRPSTILEPMSGGVLRR